MVDTSTEDEFAAFFADVEQRLRLSLVAAFGYHIGRDAAADALAWGWRNWDRLRAMDNPAGYLYRVGQSRALKAIAREGPAGGASNGASAGCEVPEFEPQLRSLLSGLPEQQRVSVWLVHGLGYRHREVAELLGCSISTIATHVRRGLAALRVGLEVNVDG
ncbi:MAG: RNA polymerase sigma factor [Acidimicrobiia bacterium]|nr:RNA polymerase sigma factor [Acidimicrobiia bacterium]